LNWTAPIDAYCERTDPSLWSEPLNAVSNLAFLLAAMWMWRRCDDRAILKLLTLLLFAIGLGSAAWHFVAQGWASVLDTIFIAGFVLVYIYGANRHVWALPVWLAAGLTALFLPYVALLTPVFSSWPFFSVSSFYWPIPLLIVIYALLLSRRAPDVSRGFSRGAALLVTSLVFRSIDSTICSAVPVGTHFIWHILNALMLVWMIEVLRRHMAVSGKQ
jgi:hypothetical protein